MDAGSSLFPVLLLSPVPVSYTHLAKAAVAVGADGLMIEVHPDPAKALSDGPQSLTFDAFDKLMADLKPYVDLAGRTFEAR